MNNFFCRNNIYPKNSTMIEFICNISNLQRELESQIKNNLELNLICSKQEKEINFMKQINIEMDMKKEKIIESLQIGINDLEEAKTRVKFLESDKTNLNVEIKEIKNLCEKYKTELVKAESEQNYLNLQIENLKNTSDKNKNEIELLNNIINEKEDRIIDLNQLVDQQSLLENKILEYKEKFLKQNEDVEKILSEKKNLENDIFTFDKKYEKLITEKDLQNKKAEENILFYKDKLDDFKKLYEEEKQKSKEKINNETEKENILKRDYDYLRQSFEDYKMRTDNLIKENKFIRGKYELDNKEKDQLSLENLKIKNENTNLILEIGKSKEKITDLIKINEKHMKEYEILNRDYINLEKEIKNKNQKNSENEENIILTKENNSLKRKIDNLNLQINRNLLQIDNFKNIRKEYEEKIETLKIGNEKAVKENQKNEYFNKKEISKKEDEDNSNNNSNFNFFNLNKYLKNLLTLIDHYSIISNKINEPYKNGQISKNKLENNFTSEKFLIKKYLNRDNDSNNHKSEDMNSNNFINIEDLKSNIYLKDMFNCTEKLGNIIDLIKNEIIVNIIIFIILDNIKFLKTE